MTIFAIKYIIKMVFKVRGVLDFNPENKTQKHAEQSLWKKTAMIRTNCELDRYYSWFLKKRFNLKLNKNLRGTHVTFIADMVDFELYEKVAAMFQGKEIDFYVETEPCSSKNGDHWWLRAHCTDAEVIRELLGLDRTPYFGMHMTLGRSLDNFLDKEHSNYIYECCKFHNLTEPGVRKPLSEHEIIEFPTEED